MTLGADRGWGADEAEARHIFDADVDRGDNFIGAANPYSNGTPEALVGKFAQRKRDGLVISTKYSMAIRAGDPTSGGNHLGIIELVESVAAEGGHRPAQVALAWTLLNPAVRATRAISISLESKLGALEVSHQCARLEQASAIPLASGTTCCASRASFKPSPTAPRCQPAPGEFSIRRQTMNLRLPKPIADYFTADRLGGDAVARCFTTDAVVTDEGRTYTGRQAIGQWKTAAAAKYSYTSEPMVVARHDDTIVVTCHLEGNFPGGTVDLRYIFRLQRGKIVSLEIVP